MGEGFVKQKVLPGGGVRKTEVLHGVGVRKTEGFMRGGKTEVLPGGGDS